MDEQQRYEQIEAYLAGEMTPNEVMVFEAQLRADASLSEELELHQLANDLISDKGLLLDRELIESVIPTSETDIPNSQILRQGGIVTLGLIWGFLLTLMFMPEKDEIIDIPGTEPTNLQETYDTIPDLSLIHI